MIDENNICKLSVEIKEGRFIYNYHVGTSKHESSSTIDPEFLLAFTDLLKFCSNQCRREDRGFMDSLRAKAWVEKNLDEAKKFISGL